MLDDSRLKPEPKDLDSVKTRLDQVLDKLENSPADLSEPEKKVFAQSKNHVNTNLKSKKIFKDLGWYWRIIKKPVLILSVLKILVYILSSFSALKQMMIDIIDPILLLVDFVFFAHITALVKHKYKQSQWQAIVTVFLAGFGFGFISSLFKLFWIREFWTIFNLITEPVFMGLVAAVIAVIAGLFIKRRRI